MKNIFLLLTLFFALNLSSQINYGFYVGSSILKIDAPDLEFQNSKMGLSAGFSFDYLYTDKFEVFIDLGYLSNSVEVLTYETDQYVKSSTLPLKFKGMEYSLIGSYNVFERYVALQAGLNGSAYVSSSRDVDEFYYVKNISSLKKPDATYGVVFGISGNYEKFRVNLRYSMSLNNPFKEIANYGEEKNYEVVDARNKYFGVTFVYYFMEY